MTEEKEIAQRNHPCWIAAFSKFLSTRPTPGIFRKWAAISAVAGALERRCWIDTAAAEIFPNLFLLFIAPPGVGKDKALQPMREQWEATGLLNVSPASMTHKGMVDQLAAPSATREFNIPGTYETQLFQRLLVCAPELGVLLPSNDVGMISALCTLYDCNDSYEERTRGAGEVLHIEKPYLHLIAGSQPKYLSNLLPEDAFQQGITSRIIMIYSGEPKKISIFENIVKKDSKEKDLLVQDLRQISNMAGPFFVEEDARKTIEEWHMVDSDKDRPTHSKLQHYNSRRIMHVLKLAMVYSAARTNTKVITKSDFDAALATLLDAEYLMPEIFKAMSGQGQASILEESFGFVQREWAKEGNKPVQEYLLRNFLASRLPLYQIDSIIDAMISGRLVALTSMAGMPVGSRLLKPLTLNLVE